MGRDDVTRRDASPDASAGARVGFERPAGKPADPHITRATFVEVPPGERDTVDMGEAADGAHLAIGTLVRERYELESVLGAGGMGVVYKALDHLHKEMHDRDPYVAIKILSDEFKRHPDALIALQRETRKAQTLAHENIIGVYNFDRDGSTVYMTMELLDGTTLRTIVAEHGSGLPPREVVPMIRAMAKALAYAHENGIAHSDFKPGNVFLTSKRQVKVLDFGVARAAPAKAPGGREEPAADAHQMGGLTPAYASLQMLAGEDPTPADDVFALAIVAHELLTGRHPFDGAPPDEPGLRRLKPKAFAGLSRPQRRALQRALAPDRESRHADAGEFLGEFERAVLWKRAGVGVAAAAALPAAALIVTMQNAEPPTDVAFEELPAEVQQRFNGAIAEGETALSFGAAGLNDALVYFSEAYDIHPNNARAVAGLEQAADRFLRSIAGADAATQRDVFEVLYCQSHLDRYAPMTAACNDSLGAAECTAISSRCRPGQTE